MKQKIFFLSCFTFYLLVNTSYFWENELGIFAFPAFALLAVVFIGLLALLLIQVYYAIRERFSNAHRTLYLDLLVFILLSTTLYPRGIISFENFENESVLIAHAEGAANCSTTLKLKSNHTFSEKTVCFGLEESKGNYELKGDTVYFKNIQLGRHKETYYSHAILNKAEKNTANGSITLYKNKADTLGYTLCNSKNSLTN